MLNLHISGDIGWFPNRDEIIRDQLAAAPEGESVSVTIGSLGGDAYQSLAIYSLLKNSGRKIITRIESIAASSASVIFCAGSERIMPEGTILMIHNVSAASANGPFENLGTASDVLSLEYAKIYAATTGKTVEEMQALMDAESWMAGDGATAAGFATSQVTMSLVARAALRDGQARMVASASNFKNAPASLSPATTAEKKTAAPTHMKKLIATLGLAENSTPEQVEAAVEKLHADHVKLKAEADAAEAKAKTDAETALTAEANTVVTDAIAAGALVEEDRAETIVAFKADKAGTTRLVAKLVAAAKNAKPDGHGAALKLTAQGGQFSAEAFAAAAKDAPDGEPRAALYREFPQMAPDGKNASKLVAFKKLNPETAKALGLVK